MRRHLRRLGDDGGIDIADRVPLGLYLRQHVAQQHAAVGALELRVGVREMLADIPQRRGTKQRVAQRVQQHVAVGMGEQPEPVWNPHAAKRDVVAFTEAVHVVTVADTHRSNTLE